jgi:hypothetical protein
MCVLKDYYLREDRESDRRNSDSFFERLRGEVSRASSSSVVTASSTEDVYSRSPESMQTNSIQTHSSLTSSSSPSIEIQLLAPEPLFTSERSIVWGTLHPHRTSQASKVPWSSKELEYIGNAIEEMIAERGGEIPKHLNSLVTDRIFKDPRAHEIFHSHHTLDSTRVRWGIQTYQKKKEKEKEEMLRKKYGVSE